jgi:hypothetical protein
MSTKPVVLIVSFLLVAGGGAGLYFGTSLFERDPVRAFGAAVPLEPLDASATTQVNGTAADELEGRAAVDVESAAARSVGPGGAAGARGGAGGAAAGERRTPEDASPLTLVGLSEDAEVVWRTPIGADQAIGCCSLAVAEDERTVAVVSQGLAVEVDVQDGERRSSTPTDLGGGADERGDASDEDGAATAPGRDPLAVWRSEDGTIVRWHDLGHLVVTTADGHRVDVHGHDVWVETLEPLVVGSPEHLMGVRTPPAR